MQKPNKYLSTYTVQIPGSLISSVYHEKQYTHVKLLSNRKYKKMYVFNFRNTFERSSAILRVLCLLSF